MKWFDCIFLDVLKDYNIKDFRSNSAHSTETFFYSKKEANNSDSVIDIKVILDNLCHLLDIEFLPTLDCVAQSNELELR